MPALRGVRRTSRRQVGSRDCRMGRIAAAISPGAAVLRPYEKRGIAQAGVLVPRESTANPHARKTSMGHPQNQRQETGLPGVRRHPSAALPSTPFGAEKLRAPARRNSEAWIQLGSPRGNAPAGNAILLNGALLNASFGTLKSCATPSPILRPRNQPRSYRIQVDVVDHLPEMPLVTDIAIPIFPNRARRRVLICVYRGLRERREIRLRPERVRRGQARRRQLERD